jgi:uracil-DNA glycosylase
MKEDLLRKIKEEVINLKESPLYQQRVKNKVFCVIGEGNHDAKIMFVGEAPGEKEAATGRPFCGRAGKILTELLNEIGLDRKNVYITNILKDRPPANRDPLPEEIECYSNFLDRQIEIINPKVIVTLGRFSMNYLMEKYGLEIKPISVMHGQVVKIQSRNMIPLYHPAVALYSPSKMNILRQDFLFLKNFVKIE